MYITFRRTDKLVLFIYLLVGLILSCGFVFLVSIDNSLFFAVSIGLQGLIYIKIWQRFKGKIPDHASWGNSPELRLRSEIWWILFTGAFFAVNTLVSIALFKREIILTWQNTLFLTVAFTLWAAFVNIGGEFLHVYYSVKHSIETVEHNRNEVIKLKKEVLQDLISPHFLFNSLNTISSVISENKAVSVRFVKELSDLYSFMLHDSHESVISLEKDIELAKKYAFLLKTRIEDGINVSFDVPSVCNRCLIPPMTVQNLVENCVKHNVVSKKTVLQIDIYVENTYLVVKNNLNLKMNSGKGSTSLGLNYISSQMERLSEENITVSKTKDEFIVRVPLVYEHTRKVMPKASNYGRAGKGYNKRKIG